MSSKKKVSKRQAIRARRKRQERLRRLGTIGVVVAGAISLAFLLIYPNFQSPGEIVAPDSENRPMAEGTAMGNPEALVRIDVFEDFQCPACVYYTEEVEGRIAETYVASGQVYYVFRHYPFLDRASVTKESQQAANASMCAGEQGLFWEYHDMLFANWNGENAGAFSDRRLLAFSEVLELDIEQFSACFKENRYQDEIQADFELGLEMGATGTPSVFVNEQQVTPGRVPSFEDLQQAIEAALVPDG